MRAGMALMLQYRASLLIWLIGLIVQPVMYLVVWTATAAGAGGSVGGYGPQDFAAYYLVLMLVDHATFTWIMYMYEWEIRQGHLSAKLLKPLTPIHIYAGDNMGYKLLTLTVVLPVFFALALYFRPNLHPTWGQVGPFVVAVLLGGVLRWLLEYTLALAAFWTTRVSALNQAYDLLFWFLSGFIAPTALLPGLLQTAAVALPFRYSIAFPVELLLGRLDSAAILYGFTLQVVWLGAAYALHRVVWQLGLRRYSAVGA